MFTRKAAVAIMASLATVTAIGASTPASAESKQARSEAHTEGVVRTGGASTATRAKAPNVTKKEAPAVSAAERKAGSEVSAALTKDCYVYSNGTGDLCLWYYQNYQGSRGGVYANDPDLWDNYFATPGAGQYQSMKNNAESVYNYDRYYRATVATSTSGYGYRGTISPRTGGNFNSTYINNVESIYWG